MSTFVPASSSALQATLTHPRPSYFISRSSHCLVPLIPADELPFNIRLQGIPRGMTIEQTHGMQHVGSAAYTGQFYKVEDITSMQRSTSQPPSTPHARSHSGNGTKPFMAPDHLVRQALGQTVPPASAPPQTTSHPSLPQRPLSASAAASSWRRSTPESTDQTQAVIDAIVGADPEAAARIGYQVKPCTTPPSGAIPNQDNKEFCTYWIRTGECDYTQQGCLYKHEMPDRATLHKIGFRDVPRWWQEKSATFKLGTEAKSTVGPPTKTADWLKNKPGKSSDGDDESTASGSESDSDRSASASTTEPVTAKVQQSTKSDRAASPPAPPPSPVLMAQDRKVSMAGSDLIDFAPLLPTPSTSAALSPGPETSKKPVTAVVNKASKETSPTKARRVFVPNGESVDQHIAEAKKHASRSTTGKARTSSKAPEPSEQKQIQILQRAYAHNGGLMASKHAPRPSSALQPLPPNAGEHRRTKTGCRIRRPATTSAPVAKPRVTETA